MVIEWNFIMRLLVAGLLGGLIGLERELRAKEAGLRTHFIVALGSALFMIISQFAFDGQAHDASRVAAQVVSGIGFIGAGVIIFQKNAVRGITTAAGLWVAAAIGLACGAGMFAVSVAATLMTVFCLEAMHFITLRYGDRMVSLGVSATDRDTLMKVLSVLGKEGVKVERYSLSDGRLQVSIRLKQRNYTNAIEHILTLLEGVTIEHLD
ncbi:MAG: MgtC/SapB family protein [Bacteroidales bacterium]|nr:MgtC/SapB family protein [Bacteroidales bacterium]